MFLETIHVKIITKDTLQFLGLPHKNIYFFNMNNINEYHQALQFSKIRE